MWMKYRQPIIAHSIRIWDLGSARPRFLHRRSFASCLVARELSKLRDLEKRNATKNRVLVSIPLLWLFYVVMITESYTIIYIIMICDIYDI